MKLNHETIAAFRQTSTTVTCTSSQILQMHSSPIIVVPAPGPGFLIFVIGVMYQVAFNTTPYNGHNNPGLYYANDTARSAMLDYGAYSVFSANSNTLYPSGVEGNAISYGSSPENQPVIFSDSADPSSGDSAMMLSIIYNVIPAAY